MDVGILEFREDEFARSVAAGLSGLSVEFMRLGHLSHPTPPPYSVIVDRISFCDPFLRGVMRYWSLGGARVINDPFFTTGSDKLSEILWCDRLSIPHPKSILLPRVNTSEDLREMVAEPDWKAIESQLAFPCILKPVDGYAWQDVHRVESPAQLATLYEKLKGTHTLLLQEEISYVDYFRAFCVNRRDVLLVKWIPRPLDMGEYLITDLEAIDDLRGFIVDKTIELNGALGLDFNSVEWCVTKDRRPCLIDAYNDVPDVRKEKLPPSYFDWIVERFCACVREKLASRP